MYLKLKFISWDASHCIRSHIFITFVESKVDQNIDYGRSAWVANMSFSNPHED